MLKYLAEDDVEPTLVRCVGNDDQDGEEEEGEDGLPDLHLVCRDNNKDDDQPDVSKDGGGGRYDEDREVLDPPDLHVGDPCDADGGDGQQVEGGRANDGAWTELFRFEPAANDSNHRQKNLRGG